MTGSGPARPPELLRAPVLGGVTHGFATRRGGVSEGWFDSLNCSLSSGDAPARVAANRAAVAAAIGLSPDRLLGATQLHGIEVATVTGPWAAGAGPRVDAMVTAVPELGLGIVTADCAPVLLADPGAGVVGAAHAGWRGAASGVLEAALDAMEALGARRGAVSAAIGPCIARASYEVGPDMRDGVLGLDPDAAAWFSPGPGAARFRFDLAGYCAARLARAGVGDVGSLDLDTCADEARFFSHRRRTRAGGHPLGHQLSVIRL